MARNPKVTVLMSVYNGERYLNEAIDSILVQTFTDYEFLIIDDGSIDSSLRILQSYNDPKIRLIRNNVNIGLTKSLNLGFKIANGEYIARMDADDISYPQRLEIQTLYMDQHPDVGVCGSAVQLFGKTNRRIDYPETYEEITAAFLFYCPIVHSSVIIRKKILNGHNISYNESYIYAQDFELWTRCAEITNFYNIRIALIGLRAHKYQIGTMYAIEQDKFRDLVIQKNLRRIIKNPTDTELFLHQQIISVLENDCILSGNKPLIQADIGNYLIKLQKINNQKKIFDPTYFNWMLAKIWFSFFFIQRRFIRNITAEIIFYHLYWLIFLMYKNSPGNLIHSLYRILKRDKI